MRVYLARRLLLLVPTLVGVSIITFSLIHLAPGDPVSIMLGEYAASAEHAAKLRSQLGLDRPLPLQYWRYVVRALRGDLGESIRSRRAVLDEITDRFRPTLELTLAAMMVSVAGGIILGVVAASSRRPGVDSASMATALIGLSMPSFWLGLLLIMLFSLRLRWFPVTEVEGIRALILPAVTLGLPGAAVLARVTRSSLLETLRQDYVRTARAKGVREGLVVYHHALRNALIPVLTIIGLQFGGRLAGAVIVESVFARPGLGRLAVNAILARDFPLVQGVVLVAATMYVLVNLTVDACYTLLDPRIRYQ
jgi:ABC-type dipeptide/oligopeptide/nickel transport system permease component